MYVIDVIAQGSTWCPMCGSMRGWGWAMMLVWAVVLAGVLWIVLQVARRQPGGGAPPESAEELLRRRYAGGEIDQGTFDRMMADLRR